VGGSLPSMIDFYEEHAGDRERFEILAFHDASAKSFEELDEKLAEIKEKRWKGRDLPFPILLDSTGETIRQFGVRAFPTVMLVQPDGRLWGRGGVETLKKALAGELEPAQPVGKH